eukprot:197590_1
MAHFNSYQVPGIMSPANLAAFSMANPDITPLAPMPLVPLPLTSSQTGFPLPDPLLPKAYSMAPHSRPPPAPAMPPNRTMNFNSLPIPLVSQSSPSMVPPVRVKHAPAPNQYRQELLTKVNSTTDRKHVPPVFAQSAISLHRQPMTLPSLSVLKSVPEQNSPDPVLLGEVSGRTMRFTNGAASASAKFSSQSIKDAANLYSSSNRQRTSVIKEQDIRAANASQSLTALTSDPNSSGSQSPPQVAAPSRHLRSGGGGASVGGSRSEFDEYRGCHPEAVLSRTRHVIKRDNIPKNLVCEQSGLSMHVLMSLLKGKAIGDQTSSIRQLAAWLWNTDDLFSSHVRTRITTQNIEPQRVAFIMGVEPGLFEKWLDRQLDLDARERLDTLLTSLFPNLTNGRAGVFDHLKPAAPLPAETVSSGPKRGHSPPAGRAAARHQKRRRKDSRVAVNGSKESTSTTHKQASQAAPSTGTRTESPSLGSALANKHAAAANGLTGGPPARTSTRRSAAQSSSSRAHYTDEPSTGSPRSEDTTPTGAGGRAGMRTRSKQRAMSRRHEKERERQDDIDGQLRSAFTEVRPAPNLSNPPASLGPTGPSTAKVIMSQSKINFENIMTLIDAKRFDEAHEVAMTSALLLQAQCCPPG